MLQIDNLSVQALRNNTYVGFMMFTKNAVENDGYIQEAFGFYADRFMASYSHLDEVFLKYDIDACTQAVQEADNNRDMKFRKMRDMIKMFVTYPESEEKTLAATMLMKVIELYGGTDIPNQGFIAETAIITNLVDDFEKRYMAQVELLGIGDALAALKSAQKAFDESYMARDLCESQIGKNAVAEARARMDEDYRLLVSVINNKKYEDTAGHLDAFIKLMNVEIGRNRTYTGQGQVGGTKPKPEEGEESDDKKVTLTFEKADETVIRLTGLTGEEYEIPELLPEHIWVKADGEIEAPTGIFPAEDTTYIEVALGERKGAFYHYLSGEHETFYGLPGTEYTVPQIPEGCKWMPEPTGQIPEEDTQYFETLVPEGGSEDSENSDGSEEKPDTPPAGEEKPKYTVNWINKDGETVKTMQVEAGTKLTSSDYPRASSGYVWKPSWIGGGLTINGDTTIREELDDDLGV